MQVTFNYFAQVRQAAGVASDRVSVSENADVVAALAALAERHGDEFRALVLDPTGGIRTSLLTLVNGQLVPHGEKRPLAEGDQVSLLSAVAGG
jgi:molybdopterin converting factor small subunit